jgi:hypothetical protein
MKPLRVLGPCLALTAGLAVAVPGAASADQATASAPVGAPAVLTAPTSLVNLTPTLPQDVIAASTATDSKWKPEHAIYGTASRNNIAIKGAGGTIIRVNEIYPTTKDGRPAKGKFPVVMTMTPYGKGSGGKSKPGSAQNSGGGSVTGGADNVVEDVRGTGNSNGQFGLFDPIQQQDAIRVLHWAAHLPHSDGRVGTYGPSYLGIDQALLAGAVGKHSPLKAIFPMVTANDSYRDTSFMGGLLDAEFSVTYLGLTGGLNTANPLLDAVSDTQTLEDLLNVTTDHANGLASFDAAFTAETLGGGDSAYDQTYWKQRAPQGILERIVANRIPAFLVGGEFDIFQHGEPINYAELQNVWDHRSATAPMLANQPVTGRYQLIDGPWEHLNGSSVNVDSLELEWFDTWLKHEHTGMARTRTPLHYYDLGTGRFDETTTYPFTNSTPTRLYLNGDNTLTTSPAIHPSSASLLWLPTGVPCGRPVDQWALGGVSIPSHLVGLVAPCADGDDLSQIGPGEVSFTTAPFANAKAIAGPISATIYATSTTAETQWVAEVEDVTASGLSYPLTEGALLGSLRAVNPARSWTEKGVTVLPYHPYTQASAKPVVPGQLTKYEIEIFPTLATIGKGDRLRVTLSTSDVPHLLPLPSQLTELAGGSYSIKFSPRQRSSLNVEFRKP